MDYAKYAYVKAKELEEQIVLPNSANKNATIEFVTPVMNMQLTSSVDIPLGKVNLLGDVCFQLKVVSSALVEGSIAVELLLDEVSVITETRTLAEGENQTILTKAYRASKPTAANLSARVTITSSSFTCQIKNCGLVVWGDIAEINTPASADIRALALDGQAIVSYCDEGKIYAATTAVAEKSFLPTDFSFVASGISHCFAKHKTSGDIYFFRVDSAGSLYYCNHTKSTSEVKLDDGVSWVSARCCPQTFKEDILITYIKNGKPCYKNFTNATVGSCLQFNLPSGSYSKVEVADAPTSAKMYVICTHTNGSNYILMSAEEDDLSRFTEHLLSCYALVVHRYVNLKGAQNKMYDTLSAKALFEVIDTLVDYDQLLKHISEGLQAEAAMSVKNYEIIDGIDYKITVNQLVPGSEPGRMAYGGSCTEFTPAKFDFDDTTIPLIDNGWLDRWPFNQIKPCLFSSGVLLGYLDPNNYANYIDGTAAPITDQANDVMVEFPKIYYKIEHDWDGKTTIEECQKSTYTISISDVPRSGYCCYAHTRAGVEYDKIYISAYENRVNTNGVVCCSGVSPSSLITHKELLLKLSQFKGDKYTTFNYHACVMLQLLYLLMFRDTRSITTIGLGYSGTATLRSGMLNTSGMYLARSKTKSTGNTKIFGLESLVMGISTMVDGIVYTDDCEYLVIDNTNPDSIHSNEGEGYLKVATGTPSKEFGVLKMVLPDTRWGFLPMQIDTNATLMNPINDLYDCSAQVCTLPESNYMASNTTITNMWCEFGGRGNDNCKYGMFSVCADASYNVTKRTYNERLMCWPTEAITNK